MPCTNSLCRIYTLSPYHSTFTAEYPLEVPTQPLKNTHTFTIAIVLLLQDILCSAHTASAEYTHTFTLAILLLLPDILCNAHAASTEYTHTFALAIVL